MKYTFLFVATLVLLGCGSAPKQADNTNGCKIPEAPFPIAQHKAGPFQLGEPLDTAWIASHAISTRDSLIGDESGDTWQGVVIAFEDGEVVAETYEDGPPFSIQVSHPCFQTAQGIHPGISLTEFLELAPPSLIPQNDLYDLSFFDPDLQAHFFFNGLIDVGSFFLSEDYIKYFQTGDRALLQNLPDQDQIRLSAIRLIMVK